MKNTLTALLQLTARQSLLFIILLLLFFGSGWSPQRIDRLVRFHVAVVDADGGPVGEAVRFAIALLPYSVTVLPASTTLSELRAATEDGSFSAAWRVAENASARLEEAIFAAPPGGDTPYDPASAAAFIYDEGRAGSKVAVQWRNASASVFATARLRVSRAALVHAAAAGVAVADLNVAALLTPVAGTVVNLHPVI